MIDITDDNQPNPMTPAQYKSLRQTIGTQSHVASLLGVSRPTIVRRESTSGRISFEAEAGIISLIEAIKNETNPAAGGK